MSHFYMGVTDRIVRKPFDRERLYAKFEGESRTQMADQASCDVNMIMARFQRTGILPEGKGPGQYGDVTDLQKDLTESIEKSRQVIADAKMRVAEANSKRAKEQAEKLQKDLEELKALRAAADAAKAQKTEGVKDQPS